MTANFSGEMEQHAGNLAPACAQQDNIGKAWSEASRHDSVADLSSPEKATISEQNDIHPTDYGKADDVLSETSTDEFPKYDFRSQAREMRGGFTSTWVDQDQTGDYDPSEEVREARVLRNRMRARAQQRFGPQSKDREAHESHHMKYSRECPKLIVKLSLQSELIKAHFSRLVSSISADEAAANTERRDGYLLRKRDADPAFTYSPNYDSNRARFNPDLPANPTGHPFARGCWECISFGHRCPLIDDGAVWPCSDCITEDIDCELITPPDHKQACEKCRSRRIGCSYSYTLNHGLACEQCMEDGFHCIAGPSKDTAPRITYDRDYSKHLEGGRKPSKRKPASTCVECVRAGLTCSLSAASEARACNACKINGDPCTIQRLIPATRRKPSASRISRKRHLDEPSSPRHHQSKAPRLAANCGGKRKTIETKLCHPITFNCDDEQTNCQSCHFCEEMGYGLLGMGSKTVEVIDPDDGQGLKEISGGHGEDGIENTRMCISCTMQRMSIIMCSGHEMTPASGCGKAVIDKNEALSQLLSGQSEAGIQWCAICPSPATYSCFAAAEDGCTGCGLHLCETCMLNMVGSHDGDLQGMLLELKDEPSEDRIFGLRADYDLLRQDGLLMRYVLSSN